MVRANREIQIPGFELLEQLRDNADLEFRGQRGVPARIAMNYAFSKVRCLARTSADEASSAVLPAQTTRPSSSIA